MGSNHEAAPVLGECLDHHNFLIFGEPVEPINAGTSALAAEIARRWNAHEDLIEALELVVWHEGRLTGSDWTEVRAAIAKATGK